MVSLNADASHAPALVQHMFWEQHLLAGGREYPLIGPLIIGRGHSCPSDACRRRGFWRPPDVAIRDDPSYVSRHHAKVQLDSRGNCWIEDLYSLNGTAILRVEQSPTESTSPSYFEPLSPGRGYRLLYGDIVALAYAHSRGPYYMITFLGPSTSTRHAPP
jgi:hypothetical protein